MTKAVYRDLLITKLIPAIQEKWPNIASFGRTIRIQQDGAKPHISPNDEEFRNAVEASGLNLELYTQPAQSPDLNILDLGFFRAIQSFMDAAPKDEFELIRAVEQAYKDYDAKMINRVFLTLQSCMNQIIETNGSNRYKIPHMGKEKLEREGKLPLVLNVTPHANKLF